MTKDEILAKLRQIYVEGFREWDENYDAFVADLNRRVGCLSVQLTQCSGTTVGMSGPTGDVHYYSFEMPVLVPRDRFSISKEARRAGGR